MKPQPPQTRTAELRKKEIRLEKVTREVEVFEDQDGKLTASVEYEPKRNLEKVTICRIGELEFYVYPYDKPDKVYMGIWPYNVELDKNTVNMLMKAYNRSRWFLKGKWEHNPHRTKAAHTLGCMCRRAYSYGKNEAEKEKEAQNGV